MILMVQEPLGRVFLREWVAGSETPLDMLVILSHVPVCSHPPRNLAEVTMAILGRCPTWEKISSTSIVLGGGETRCVSPSLLSNTETTHLYSDPLSRRASLHMGRTNDPSPASRVIFLKHSTPRQTHMRQKPAFPEAEASRSMKSADATLPQISLGGPPKAHF